MNKDKILEIAAGAFDDEINSLIAAKDNLDGEFAKAALMIHQSNKTVITGVGKSGLIARKIAATLSSIGSSSVFIHPVEALHGDIGIIQENDVVILLSKSGSTEELIKFVPYVKLRKARIISILGNKNSILARYSDAVLDGSVAKEACPFNLAPTSSTTVALAIGDALAITQMKLKQLTLEDFSKLHPLGQIGRNITVQVKDEMHSGKSIPMCSPETSFRDALIEMTSKDLGCVCITDENITLLGIITDGDVRRILQKHEDMRGLTAGEVMTRNPVSVSGEAYLGEALALMENRDSEISVLPVVDFNKKVTGVIRLHDVVKSGR